MKSYPQIINKSYTEKPTGKTPGFLMCPAESTTPEGRGDGIVARIPSPPAQAFAASKQFLRRTLGSVAFA